jgi:hypothetical protein
VEFTPAAGYGFEKWVALPTGSFDPANPAATDLSQDLNGNSVAITESIGASGARTAAVTINTATPVTLVPWCTDRPGVAQTNPPLINSGISYTRGQTIRITFGPAMKLQEELAEQFGPGYIEINGLTVGEESEIWDDPATEADEAGDLTGRQAETMRYFKTPVYDPNTNIITISPEDDGDLTARRRAAVAALEKQHSRHRRYPHSHH